MTWTALDQTLGRNWASPYYRYALSVAVVLVASLARFFLMTHVGMRLPFITFFPAVTLAALYGGFGPGLLATAMSALIADLLWFEPVGHLGVHESVDVAALIIFIGSCVLISAMASMTRLARDRSIEAQAQAATATQKIRDAEALRLSEEKFVKAFASSPAPTVLTRLADGTMLNVNDAWVELMGYGRGEVIGKTTLSLAIWPAAEGRNRFAAELRARQQISGWEQEFCKRSGEKFLALLAAQVLQVHGEAVVLSTILDITQIRQAQAQLSQSEERFRLLVEQAPDGIFVSDAQGHYLDVNSAGCQMLRYTREQLLGLTIADVIAPEEVPRIAMEVAKLFGGKVARSEWRFRRSDGTFFIGEVLVRQLSDGRLQAVLRDITASRAAEDALRASEDRFRTMAESIPQLAWIANADGWIHWYNRRWYEYTGTTPEQMEGWGWQSVHDPQTLPNVMERWKASIASGQPFDMTFPLRGADGTFRPFLTRTMPLRDIQGKVVQWFGTNTDVSEQIRVEQELTGAKLSAEQARATAEAATRAKDHFLAVLSHELRTPLNPALLATTLIEADPQLPPEFLDDVKIIRRSIELEARLIDDLLDVTRIARGKLKLNRQVVDARETVRHAVETCQAEAAEKQLALDVQLSDQPLLVEGDFVRLQQVFWNLLKNAIKFTPAQGRIAVVVEPSAGGGCRIQVSDTGKGIEPQALLRIFDAFEQGNPAVTQHFGGLGLGLAICKGLVTLHNGSIVALSEGPGQGAVFVVDLPPPSPASSLPTQQIPEAGLRPSQIKKNDHRILLVEDHDSTARMTSRLLESFGYHVMTANSLTSGLELFDRERFDLVISDLGLPDGSGHDLLRRVRKTSSIPAIALSGYGMDSDLRQSAEVGFAEHLVKPVNAAQLGNAIQRALANVS